MRNKLEKETEGSLTRRPNILEAGKLSISVPFCHRQLVFWELNKMTKYKNSLIVVKRNNLKVKFAQLHTVFEKLESRITPQLVLDFPHALHNKNWSDAQRAYLQFLYML